MRAKGHAVFCYLAQFAEAEDLKSARVCKDGPRPRHEAVKPAKLANLVHPRTQIKVIGVAQQNLNIQIFEHILRNAFYRGQRAYRHEYWRLNFAVRRDQT